MTPVLARLDDKHPNRIVIESEYEHATSIKEFTARKWSVADKVWTLPLSWSSCIQLRSAFGSNLIIQADLASWATEYRANYIEPALELREAVEIDEDSDKKNDVTEQALVLRDELKLFPHQACGAAFMASTDGCGIFDETGTGKSAQTITAIRSAHRAGKKDIFPVLIVVPNSIKTTWKREWNRWWPELTVHIVEGGTAQRRKVLQTPGHVYIINYEQMARHSRLTNYGSMELKRCTSCGGLDEKITNAKCEVHERELNQIPFQTVVCDEAHRMLHPSKQTRAIWSVSDKAARRYALTGTPVQNDLNDFWFILRYIRPNDFPAKTRFIDRYAETSYSEWGVMQINGLKPHREDEFRQITQLLSRRMLKKIVLPFLPPIVYERRYIEMTSPQKKVYQQMLKKAFAVLEKEDTTAEGESDTVTATSPLSVATRLLQFASSYGVISTEETAEDDTGSVDEEGPAFLDEKLKLALPSNKITAFLSDIESGDFGDSSIVVFAQSRQLIDLLSAEMTRKKLNHGLITGAISTEERQKHIDDFQDGKTKYILVTIAAGGVGLTLTAADTMVFIQRSYSSTGMSQAKSRSHRIGSEIHESVTIVDYISEGTIEEKQLDALQAKDGRIEEILKDKDLLKKFLDTKD